MFLPDLDGYDIMTHMNSCQGVRAAGQATV